MTLTNASPPSKGRPARKFTPEAVEKIKELVAQGISRDEIANLLDVTVGSLQVTCSRLGISLRRCGSHGNTGHPTLGKSRRTVLPFRLLGQTAKPSTEAKFKVTLQFEGAEQTTDLSLSPEAIGQLGLEAVMQDAGILELISQAVVDAIKKDLIEQILRDDSSPSKT